MSYSKTLPPPFELAGQRSLSRNLEEEVAELQRQLELERQETQQLRVDVVRLMRELDQVRAPLPPARSADRGDTGSMRSNAAARELRPVSDVAPRATFEAPPLGGKARSVQGMAAPDQGLDFGAVARLTPEQLDGLPYGLVTLDADGRILHYNDTEARLVGLSKEQVLGRNFFGDVAPCTRVREFEGAFRELVRDPLRVRVQTFDFVFRFARGEQHVTIVMTPARARGQFHLAMVRRQV